MRRTASSGVSGSTLPDATPAVYRWIDLQKNGHNSPSRSISHTLGTEGNVSRNGKGIMSKNKLEKIHKREARVMLASWCSLRLGTKVNWKDIKAEVGDIWPDLDGKLPPWLVSPRPDGVKFVWDLDEAREHKASTEAELELQRATVDKLLASEQEATTMDRATFVDVMYGRMVIAAYMRTLYALEAA